jgi:hypothetical protein
MGKGRIIGNPNNPTSTVASGVWSLTEQLLAQKDSIWPQFIAGLYAFTSATFTPGGATGSSGPTLTQARTGLTGTGVESWKDNTSYFNTSNGIQLWTVPQTGDYEITLTGAHGGSANTSYGFGAPGQPASFKTILTLTQGHIIQILVGQMGGNGNAGNNCGQDGAGGGGTFVYNQTTATILAVAGGGGGAGSNGLGREETLKTASNSINGNKGSGTTGGAGGTNGGGGSIQSGSCVNGGASGAGFSGNGATNGQSTAALSFLNGGTGGSGGFAIGGFGGGGASGTQYTGGGGGGYSGGGGGGVQDCDCNDLGNGGAGGSYSIATITDFTNPTTQSHGSCTIVKL